MKKLFIILLSVFSLTAFAQQKQKLAVYVICDSMDVSVVLSDQLVDAYTESGEYVAVERTAAFLEKLGKDRDPMLANMDNQKLSSLAKKMGVQLVCVAQVRGKDNPKYLSARLIDVETTEVIKNHSKLCEIRDLKQFLPEARTFARELTGLADKDREAAKLEELAKAEQKRISDSIAQSKQPKTIDTYKMLSEAYVKGYIIVDQLQVATSFSNMNWDDALVVAKECRIGGFSDWRLPTVSELENIYEVCRNFERDWNDKASSEIGKIYYINGKKKEITSVNQVDEIKGVTRTNIEKIEYLVNRNYCYWTASGKVLDGRNYKSCSKLKKCRVLLVRDIKESK